MPLPVPPDFEAALAQSPHARARFDALPPEAKDRWIAWIQRARLGGSRRRRIAYAIQRLGAAPAAAVATEQVVEEPLPPRPPVWPWLLALALALLLAALLLWLLVFRDNDNGTRNNVVLQKATVPSVVGQPQPVAASRVKAANLNPVSVSRQAEQPPGTVVDQDPNGGMVVKAGTIVKLIVSKGPPPVAVPNVTGLGAADAVAKLQAAKLSARLVEVKSNETAGTVVAQKPGAGTKAKPGSKVVLDVSKGAGQVTVPVVTGETVSQAVGELQRAGLKASTANVASDQPKGTVVAQSPRAGERVAKGSTVRLNVSKGPPATTATATTTAATTTVQQTTTQRSTTTQRTTTTQPATTRAAGVSVPSLIGKGIASALGALERAGLRATVKYQSSQAPLGQVRGQNPAAGTKVPRGTRVQVNVSEGPNPGNPTQVPDTTGEDEAMARSDLENAGFKVVVIQRTGGGQSGTVVEQQPPGGSTIASGDFVAIYVAR